MNKPTFTRLLVLSVTVAVALALAGSASAVEPTRTTEVIHPRFNPYKQCPGFVVIGRFDVVREITTFYDENGVPVRRIIHATISGTVTNALTGYSLPAAGVRIFHYDLSDGSFVVTGDAAFEQLPGGGTAHTATGLLEFDAQGNLVDYHGPDENAELAQLCAALA
jgi:hypothetical protein